MTKEISPAIKFVPRLYTIAIPILRRKINGKRNESIVSASTSADNPAAITTYMMTSLLQIFLISVTTADIPLKRHCSLVSPRISSMASSVSSADMDVSNVMIISWLPVSAFCRESFKSSGSISIGIEISASAPYHKTSFT